MPRVRSRSCTGSSRTRSRRFCTTIREKKALDDELKAKLNAAHQGIQDALRAARSKPRQRSKQMPSLIDIRRRIRSVKNTQQITKAMKMVSAAKLRRAQDRVIAARPYAALLRKVLANVAAAAASDETRGRESAAGAARPEKRILLVLVTGDSGLAGAFNSNLIKAAQRFLTEHAGREDHVRS